jgi:cryptochrome
MTRVMHWFRKGLRVHDNAGLEHASQHASALFPVFILDPAFVTQSVMTIGANRWNFL